METQRLYSIPQAARILGVTVRTLYDWHKAGWINYVRPGGRNKVTKAEIERLCGQSPVSTISSPDNKS